MSAVIEELGAQIVVDSLGEEMLLGHEIMDKTHSEFLSRLAALMQAEGEEFKRQFIEFHYHTEKHFNQEHQFMKQTGFPSLVEHHADHLRVLGEMTQFRMRVQQGRIKMAKAYVSQQLPAWFRTHLLTMDSALSAHILKQN